MKKLESELINEGFILTKKELMVLLAAKQISIFFAFEMEKEEISDQEICYLLNHLFVNRIIESKENKFTVRPELDEMLNVLKGAEKLYLFSSISGFVRTLSFYRKEDKYVFLCPLSTNENEVKLEMATAEEVTQWLDTKQDEKYTYQPILEDDAIFEEILMNKKPIEKDLKFRYHNIAKMLETIDMENGVVTERIVVRYLEEQIEIVHRNGKEVTRAAFDEDLFRTKLEENLFRDKKGRGSDI